MKVVVWYVWWIESLNGWNRIIFLVNKMSKIILVIGGVGFIGLVVVCYFINDIDYIVVNLDKLIYVGNLELLILVLNSDCYSFE